jgi:hypothetical protein
MACSQRLIIRNDGRCETQMAQRNYSFGERFARIVPSYVPLNRLPNLRSVEFHIYHRYPCALLVSGRGDAGVKHRFALPVARIQCLFGIVSNPLILYDHILSSLSYLVGGGGHVRHLIGLFLGGFSEHVSIGGARFHFLPLESDKETSKQVNANNHPCPPKGRFLVASQLALYFLEFAAGLWLGCFWRVDRLSTLSPWSTIRGCAGVFGAVVLVVHSGLSVTQKLLTTLGYCNTLIASGTLEMANVLSTDKQIAVISQLGEGSSIRSIERIMGVHRDTIMRLGVRVGQGCAKVLDAKMQNLSCHHLQFDALWGFIGKKEKHREDGNHYSLGDVWTFCATDEETKIVPSEYKAIAES